MAVAPYTPSEVDAFRERGDAFNRDMLQEYYDHFAGLKDTLDIERVYEEYEDLTRLETAQRLEHARPSCGGSPARATSATSRGRTRRRRPRSRRRWR